MKILNDMIEENLPYIVIIIFVLTIVLTFIF